MKFPLLGRIVCTPGNAPSAITLYTLAHKDSATITGCPANYGALDLALIEGQACDHATSSVLLCLALLTFCARGGGKGCQLPRVLKKTTGTHWLESHNIN